MLVASRDFVVAVECRLAPTSDDTSSDSAPFAPKQSSQGLEASQWLLRLFLGIGNNQSSPC